MKKPFVPEDFEIPATLENPHFRLRMLSVADVHKDYEAVIESRDLLHRMGSTWPSEDFTLADNLADLEMHQMQFLNREAFAYTVVSLDEGRVLGCVYINPPKDENADARVHMWVRQSEFDKGLDPVLFAAVKQWLKECWPFQAVKFIGRE
jgi:hypothetical protein